MGKLIREGRNTYMAKVFRNKILDSVAFSLFSWTFYKKLKIFNKGTSLNNNDGDIHLALNA